MVQAGKFGKLLTVCILSDVGLLTIVGLYVFGGAYLFQNLEYDNEEDLNRKSVEVSVDVDRYRASLPERIWLYKWENPDDYATDIEEILKSYQAKVSHAINEHQYNFEAPFDDKTFPNKWRFSSALLFTITIVTTIGYGHVAPLTSMGQVAVILYALVGVPMNLGFLSSTGKVMASWFRNAYNHGCCYICWKQRKATFNAKRRQLIWHLKYGKAKEAELSNASTKDLQKKMKADQAQQVEEISEEEANKILREDVDVWIQFVDIMEHVEEDKNVPISLVLIVIACYLFLGSVMFSAWNNWSYLTSAYFCLVTLSTVGFGDKIPGVDSKSTKGDMQLVIVYAYIWFGLAVVSMCFNMMLIEMTSKGQWFANLLGFGDDRKKKLKLEALKMKEEEEAMKANAAVAERGLESGSKDDLVKEAGVKNRPMSAFNSGGSGHKAVDYTQGGGNDSKIANKVHTV